MTVFRVYVTQVKVKLVARIVGVSVSVSVRVFVCGRAAVQSQLPEMRCGAGKPWATCKQPWSPREH